MTHEDGSADGHDGGGCVARSPDGTSRKCAFTLVAVMNDSCEMGYRKIRSRETEHYARTIDHSVSGFSLSFIIYCAHNFCLKAFALDPSGGYC